MIVGDPRMKLLKKHLQAKKEFLKQLKTMYTSYMGGVAASKSVYVYSHSHKVHYYICIARNFSWGNIFCVFSWVN